MTFISTYSPVFTYFDSQLNHPNWKGKKVLDFGGNYGNLIRDSGSTIEHQNYWCLDVSRDALEQGRKEYPEAHWIFYNRFNWTYNPFGESDLPIPDLGQKFDYILSFSVFTHTNKTEMIELVTSLKESLVANGTLAFTFLDPHYQEMNSAEGTKANLRHYLEAKNTDPTVNTDLLIEEAKNAKYCALVNYKNIYKEDDDFDVVDQEMMRKTRVETKLESVYDTFFTAEYMKTLFPKAIILPPMYSLRQHCCVIKR